MTILTLHELVFLIFSLLHRYFHFILHFILYNPELQISICGLYSVNMQHPLSGKASQQHRKKLPNK